MNPFTEIKTKRLVIRPCDQAAANKISERIDDHRVSQYLSFLSVEQIENLLKRLCANLGDGESLIYGAWIEQQMIGYIALVNYSAAIPEVQIELDPDFQDQGYGYEFLRALLLALFAEGRYKTVRYTVLPSNEASIALVRKIGAFLQEPESEAERILLKTYLISKLSMDACEAHKCSNNHKAALEKDHVCGCFSCLKIFAPAEIDEWLVYDNPCDRLGTAVCPYCSVDSIIGESSGYPITAEFLAAMNKIWFSEN